MNWNELLTKEPEIRARFDELWKLAGGGPIPKEQAEETLALMIQRSHLDIYHNLREEYRKYFPTKQCYPGRLENVQALWWVDHATAGVNGWGTLGWFSSKPRKHSKKFDTKSSADAYAKNRKGKVTEKDGKYVVTWKGNAGASTHFTVFIDGTPFMLIPLTDGCWGEPKRNGDGIHVEMVNPLICQRKANRWHFWAGPIPEAIITNGQTPERLDKPFRGAMCMMPYTWQQVVTDIKLKRLCIAATGRMHRDRMSQHTDWRSSKYDMGPLWPFDLVNEAAFENYPIEEYNFVKQFVSAPGADIVADPEEIEKAYLYAENPEIDHDLYDEDTTIDSVKEIQQALVELYGPAILPKYGVDGDMGKETTTAVRQFQADWNRNYPADKIKIDGVPGVQTCSRLEKAIASSFSTTQP